MEFSELCQKCHSTHPYKIKSRSISGWLLKAAGYQPLGCRDCGYRWQAYLPMQPLLNMIYLFLAVEIIFLITNYYKDQTHYLLGIFS